MKELEEMKNKQDAANEFAKHMVRYHKNDKNPISFEQALEKIGRYQYSLGPANKQLIEKIIEKRPFDNIDHFINRAIEVYLTWENSPESTMGLFTTFPFTDEQEKFMHSAMQPIVLKEEFGDKINVDKYKELEKQKVLRDEVNLPSLREGFKDTLSSIDDFGDNDLASELDVDSELKYDGYPLIWRFYSRFLPTKIAIIVLADLLVKNNMKAVSLEKFRNEAYDIAEELVQEIEHYEKSKKLKRNQKISTGFPLVEDDDDDKQFVTQKRFKDQYIGKKKINKDTKEETFEGAMMALGLIRIFDVDGEIHVTMSDLGRDFVKLESPVFNGNFSKAFSDEETSFIINKILPQRKLEHKLVIQSLEKIKTFDKKTDSTKELDKLFLEVITEYAANEKVIFSEKFKKRVTDHMELQKTDPKKQTPIMAFRVATMGRLAELGVIDWEIGDFGKSRFSIPIKALTN